MQVLVLPDALRERLLAEVRQALPKECCGLIEGVATPDGWHAIALHRSKNLAADPEQGFLIDPQIQFRTLRDLRGTGRAVIGCYHSHPGGGSEPSARDRAEAMDDGFVWLIAGESGLNATAFDAAAGSFVPLRLCRRA
jgi:desampylase